MRVRLNLNGSLARLFCDSVKNGTKKTAAVLQSNSTARNTEAKFTLKPSTRNFITPLRAITEFGLKQSHLKTLPPHYRRSAYTTDLEGKQMIVYKYDDVLRKVNEVHGSLEAFQKLQEQNENDNKLFSEIKKNLKILKKSPGNTNSSNLNQPFFFKPDHSSRVLQDSNKVVIIAVSANFVNSLIKFGAFLVTGSSSMFSEFIHSIADTINQLVLAIGLRQSIRKPDISHPYGYTNMAYVASLISGVGIFFLGSGISFYHGISGILAPQPLHDLPLTFAVLGACLVTETVSLIYAIKMIRRESIRDKVSFFQHVWQSKDPTCNVVFFEDSAAVAGVLVAATSIGLTYLTGNPVYDSIGSLAVGTILGAVSTFLIYTNVEMLLGKSVSEAKLATLIAVLESDKVVRGIHDVKATEMGTGLVKFKAEVDFDGRQVAMAYLLANVNISAVLQDVKKIQTSDELVEFLLRHGENIIDRLGTEVDRLELEMKRTHPNVRHVDLEIL